MPHGRQLRFDGRRRQPLGHVEEDTPVRGSPACLNLRVYRPGHLIARQQLRWALVVIRIGVPPIGFLLGLCVLLLEYRRDVVEHEASAFRVGQDATITADGFGHQNALDAQWPHHAGWVKLDELHIDE